LSKAAAGLGNIEKAETGILKLLLPEDSRNLPKLFSLTDSRISLAMFLALSLSYDNLKCLNLNRG
jgi:hypothetical protein